MRLAVLLVRDVPTAEDIVQDSFVAMHDGWRRLRDAESALAYLRQAVLNRSRSVLRHRAVVEKYREAVTGHAQCRARRAGAAATFRGDRHAAQASRRQREAIALRCYADSLRLRSRPMGISCGAVKSHTARAMAALRADLEQQDRAWKA